MDQVLLVKEIYKPDIQEGRIPDFPCCAGYCR